MSMSDHAVTKTQETGTLATAVDIWVTSSRFQAHVYKDFNDRSIAEREAHGSAGQVKGGRWRDALNRHTGNNANWAYPHDAACHYKEDIVANGSRVRGMCMCICACACAYMHVHVHVCICACASAQHLALST